MNKKTYLLGAIVLFAVSSVVVRAQQEANREADERVVTATPMHLGDCGCPIDKVICLAIVN